MKILKKNKRIYNKWIIVELKDIVEPHQIKYECKNLKSIHHTLSFTQNIIDNHIIKVLKDFKVWEEEFKQYKNFTNTRLANIIKTTKETIFS